RIAWAASQQPPVVVKVENPEPATEEPAYWLQHLQQHWMVWLGGLCVALAGIFMVRYSIERGLVSPATRVAMGIVWGIALHVGGEWLRRRRGNHLVFAALAGGGSIALFAALLSALHLYHLLEPVTVFVMLAVVALVSMWLALLHGPVLAILGILGAYLVPALVGGNGDGIAIVLMYVLVISASALLLMRYVDRNWIWLGTLAGGVAWWGLSLHSHIVDGWRGPYLAGLTYLFVALPEGDWRLRGRSGEARFELDWLLKTEMTQLQLLPVTLFMLMLAFGLSLVTSGFPAEFNLPTAVTLPLLVLVVASGRNSLAWHPWCLLLIELAAIVLSRLLHNSHGLAMVTDAEQSTLFSFCVVSALIYSGVALVNLLRKGPAALWTSLAVMAPPAFLALAYLLTTNFDASAQWSLLAAVLGGFYLTLASLWLKRQANVLATAWLLIAGHLCYSLAVAMYLSEGGLTLALAAQIVSLGWIIKRFGLQELDWVFKLVVMAVIARLSLNPWLASYAARLHWPLYTYVGATVCCGVGVWLLRQQRSLQVWAGGAFIHLLTLTIWVVLRYVLYDGAVFGVRYGFTEAALDLNIFGALGLVYHWRANFSQQLAFLCEIYAKALLAFACINYVVILTDTLAGGNWVEQGIGSAPLLNMMLLSHGTPVVLALLYSRHYLPVVRKPAQAVATAAGFIFVSLEIMHLWRGHIRLHESVSDGELYTYSIVWLSIAIAAILGGIWRYGMTCYRTGMGLLLLVIVKLFLIDMADLTGLLRVASFMGMGLGLLAIAYLHQRLRNSAD
ncbi:MAG TPA: DUF2339 domain-containing protein, partial [Candidatus Acidoferrum sp.]|nr:DUF2339 domain-containing protein [Candidatus Acidoferrum sp.]